MQISSWNKTGLQDQYLVTNKLSILKMSLSLTTTGDQTISISTRVLCHLAGLSGISVKKLKVGWLTNISKWPTLSHFQLCLGSQFLTSPVQILRSYGGDMGCLLQDNPKAKKRPLQNPFGASDFMKHWVLRLDFVGQVVCLHWALREAFISKPFRVVDGIFRTPKDFW